jgi:hypothetical protein
MVMALRLHQAIVVALILLFFIAIAQALQATLSTMVLPIFQTMLGLIANPLAPMQLQKIMPLQHLQDLTPLYGLIVQQSLQLNLLQMVELGSNTQARPYTESRTLNPKGKTMPTKIIVDCSTGLTTEVELTAEEVAQREADAVAFAEIKAAEEAAAQAKADAKASAQAKLAALGLTADEIAALS